MFHLSDREAPKIESRQLIFCCSDGRSLGGLFLDYKAVLC